MTFGVSRVGKKVLSIALMLSFFGLCGVAEASAADKPARSRYVAYYFHGDKRCTNCVTIEKYAQEALQEHFGAELGSGELTWLSLNVMESHNQHFFYDFQLTSQVVVLAEVVGDTTVRWKRLDRVWDLLKDREVFQSYVVGETRAFTNP